MAGVFTRPRFGGVYWDTVDIPLENINTIEVIRGPGGTVLGRECGKRSHQYYYEEGIGHARCNDGGWWRKT